MSESSSPEAGSSGTPKNTKSRSPVEKAVVWGGIIVLLGLVLVELRAQQGHSTAVTKLQDLFGDDEEEVAASELDNVISWFPSKTVAVDTPAAVDYRYNWQSVFKSGQFVLHVVVSKDDPAQLVRYYTGDEDPMAPEPSDTPTEQIPAEELASMLGGAGGGGGGGGRRGRDGGESGGRPDMDDSDDGEAEDANPDETDVSGEPEDKASESSESGSQESEEAANDGSEDDGA